MSEENKSQDTRNTRNTVLEKLKANMTIEEDTGCWVWNSNEVRITLFGKRYLANHLSYKLFYGKRPKGKSVMRRCGNARCINPRHFYISGFELPQIKLAELSNVTLKPADIVKPPNSQQEQELIYRLISSIAEKYGLSKIKMWRILQDLREEYSIGEDEKV